MIEELEINHPTRQRRLRIHPAFLAVCLLLAGWVARDQWDGRDAHATLKMEQAAEIVAHPERFTEHELRAAALNLKSRAKHIIEYLRALDASAGSAIHADITNHLEHLRKALDDQ